MWKNVPERADVSFSVVSMLASCPDVNVNAVIWPFVIKCSFQVSASACCVGEIKMRLTSVWAARPGEHPNTTGDTLSHDASVQSLLLHCLWPDRLLLRVVEFNLPVAWMGVNRLTQTLLTTLVPTYTSRVRTVSLLAIDPRFVRQRCSPTCLFCPNKHSIRLLCVCLVFEAWTWRELSNLQLMLL